MEDPVNDIATAINLCAGAATPDAQVSAFHKYWMSNGSFLHPFCYVPSRPNSLHKVIGIYLFYRALIPQTRFEVEYVAFDEKNIGKDGHLFVDLYQTPHIRAVSTVLGWRPRIPMHINFHIKKVGSSWFIDAQEDVIQPMSLMLAIPILAPIGHAFYFLCEAMGLFCAWLFMSIGIWRPEAHIKMKGYN